MNCFVESIHITTATIETKEGTVTFDHDMILLEPDGSRQETICAIVKTNVSGYDPNISIVTIAIGQGYDKPTIRVHEAIVLAHTILDNDFLVYRRSR